LTPEIGFDMFASFCDLHRLWHNTMTVPFFYCRHFSAAATLVCLLLTSSMPISASQMATVESPDKQFRATLSVSPEEPALADTITLTVEVEAKGDGIVEFPPFGTKLGELDIVKVVSTERKLVLTVVPQHGGQTPIWAIPIRCGSQQITLPAVKLDIKAGVTPEEASLDNITSSVKAFDVRSYYPLWIAAALVVLAVIVLFWYLFLRQKKTIENLSAPLSPQESALRRLADLLASRKHESDVKSFFIELSDIIRLFVEQWTGIRAPELTTEEFFRKVTTRRQENHLPQLRPFLESADVVKFAKHQPTPDEIMLAFRRAEEFVRGTDERN
jgi:hypothetical protein